MTCQRSTNETLEAWRRAGTVTRVFRDPATPAVETGSLNHVTPDHERRVLRHLWPCRADVFAMADLSGLDGSHFVFEDHALLFAYVRDCYTGGFTPTLKACRALAKQAGVRLGASLGELVMPPHTDFAADILALVERCARIAAAGYAAMAPFSRGDFDIEVRFLRKGVGQ